MVVGLPEKVESGMSLRVLRQRVKDSKKNSTLIDGHKCGPNMVWAERTCDDIYCSQEQREQDCLLPHPWAGCWCKDGYQRNHNYDCVKRSDCFDQCPTYERPVKGNSYCEYTCQAARKCNMVRGPCTCLPGYFRDTMDGQCVELEGCPPPNVDRVTPMMD